MDRYEIEGYELLKRTVTKGSNSSSRVNLPLSWEGKEVKVVLLEKT